MFVVLLRLTRKFNWQQIKYQYPSLHPPSDELEFLYHPTDRQEPKGTHGIPCHHGDFLTICYRHWWRHWFHLNETIQHYPWWWCLSVCLLQQSRCTWKPVSHGNVWLLVEDSSSHFSEIHATMRIRDWQMLGIYFKGSFSSCSMPNHVCLHLHWSSVGS